MIDDKPETIEEAIQQLKDNICGEDLELIKACKTEEELIGLTHFSLGMFLRNHWGLWTGSKLQDVFLTQGIDHPDDMSGVILRRFWEEIREKGTE